MVEIDIGPIEIDIEMRRKHKHFLLAAIGPFIVEEDLNTVQQVTFQNIAAPLTARFGIGPFEEFGNDGSDMGPDSNPITFTTSDATLCAVAPNDNSNPAITAPFVGTLVPGVSGSVVLKFNDAPAGTGAGELDITILAPKPVETTLVATVGSLVTG